MIRKSLFVLLVEDDDDDAELTLRAFGKVTIGNVTLHRENSGEAALAYLQRATILPDFVLLDINLPGIQGMEVLTRLKSNKRTARIPVVPLTSSRVEDEVLKAWESQIAGYLHKPVNAVEFEFVAHSTIGWWMINELPHG